MIKKDSLFKFALIGLLILISAIITFVMPQFFLYFPISYSLVSILIISVVIILLVLFLKNRFQLSEDFLVQLVTMFFIFTLLLSYYSYSTGFNTTPNLKNENLGVAQNILEKNGFKTKISYVTANDSSGENKVLKQVPQKYMLIPKNSTVTIFVGKLESRITINQPKSGVLVPQNLTVSGTVKDLKLGEKVYLLIQPQPRSGDGPYEWYVQPTPTKPTPVKVQSDGTWKCNAYFGKLGDQNRQFKLVAIITAGTITKSQIGFDLPTYKSIATVYVTRF